MTEVFCDNYDCAYCDINHDHCTLDMVFIDGCGDCASYEEYQDKSPKFEFWKCCFDRKTNEKYRKKCFGRKIEIDGLTFYTEVNERYTEDLTNITEEKTGLLCNSITYAKGNIEKIKHYISTLPNVLEFPIREENENDV